MDHIEQQSSGERATSKQAGLDNDLEHPAVYALTAEKLSRNKQKIERRKFKDRISDRRATMRFTTDGQAQPDRREANRVAYAEMYSRLKQPH